MAKSVELTEFRMVADHPYEVRLGKEGSYMLAPGEFVEMSADDMKHPENKSLIDEGVLLNTEKNIPGKKTDPEASE